MWAHMPARLKYHYAGPAPMAKQKRSAADLDAELAALEAELAALERKPKKAGPSPAPAPGAAPAPATHATPDAPSAPAALEPEPAPAPERKGRFALPKVPKLGKRKAEAEPVPAPVAVPEERHAPTPAAPRPPAQASYDLSLWRQEGDAWVRAVPETPVTVMRRVLDESGNVVREEPASLRDVDEARGVKAERGIGRLLRRK